MANKNALQTALDLVKSGALRTMAASPIGQFASKVGQATSFLRAPSMEDLGNAYNQSVGRASSFVQKYPSPASYVAQQMPQITQPPLQSLAPDVYRAFQSYSPTQTFQKNMKLMNPAYQFTQENTPVSNFLINKVGGPGQDIFTGKLEGPQTATNYLARSFEAAIPGLMPIAPYAPTIISGLKATPGLLSKVAATGMELSTFNPQMKIRNVLKEGFNIPAAAVGATLGLAYQGGMKMLKGEKLSPEEAGSTALITGLIGSVLPSPMKGIATTDLGAARKFLSDYGFNLSDYENPALLKAKFRRNILKLHPDKGGDPELFKSFVDAYNKVTSAGIDSSWKFPDVMAWIRNLWAKRQQPTGGSMVKVGHPAPATATEGLFGKIANIVQQESGDGFHTFEGPQIRTVLKKAGLEMIPEGTIETPGFIVQYRKKDYLGNPIPPVLQVNLFPAAQQPQPPAQPVAPQVVPQPSVQPVTPVPQVPKPMVPIQSPPSSTKRILGRSANVSEGIHEAMSTATTADEALQKLNIYVGEFSKTADKRQLADLRAGLVKEITNLTGGSGDYKKDYAMRVALRNDTEIGGLVRQLEDHISAIDNGTIKSSTPPSIGGEIPKGGETQALQTAPVSDEIPSPAFLDYVREMARTVNVDEMSKLSAMSNAEANRYVEQLNQNQLTTGITGTQTPAVAMGGQIQQATSPVSTDVIFEKVKKNGGITINLQGEEPAKGFAYSPYKGIETKIPLADFTPKSISDFIEKNLSLLSKQDHYLGGWTEGGIIYWDVSRVGSPNVNTILEAEKEGQLAVFDLEKFETIYTKLSDKYETTSHLIPDSGKITKGNKEGSVQGVRETIPVIGGSAESSGISGSPQAVGTGEVTPVSSPTAPQPLAVINPSSVTPVPQVPTGMMRIGQPVQGASSGQQKGAPKVDFTVNDIELYNRLIKFFGPEMFKEMHSFGYKGGSYMMKKLDSFGKPADVINPEALQVVTDKIKSGEGFQPPLATEGKNGKFNILNHPETYFALQQLGYKFLPFIDVTGQQGKTSSWTDGEYHYDTDPYSRWNQAHPESSYQEPQQPPPPPPKPITQIMDEAKAYKMAKENQPKFFDVLDKLRFQVLTDLRPAAKLDYFVNQKGGEGKLESDLILNRGRIRGTQGEQDQLFRDNLSSMLEGTGKYTKPKKEFEIYIRANQYVYRETVLLKRAKEMMGSKNEKIREDGKELMEEIKQSRINEGNQTAESAQTEIKAMKDAMSPEEFANVESVAKKMWAQVMDSFEFKYRAGMIKEKTYKEVAGRDKGYAPYKVIMWERKNADGGIGLDGKPIKTMWGTEELQNNPIGSAYYSIMSAYKMAYQNIANQNIAKVARIIPEWVRQGLESQTPPPGFTALPVYVKGVRKVFYVPQEFSSMYEYGPLNDKTLNTVVKYTIGKTKAGFVFFVTGVRPVFTLVNKLGDIARMATFSRAGVSLLNPISTTIFAIDTIDGVLQAVASELPSGRFQTPRYKDLKRRGILQSTYTSAMTEKDFELVFRQPTMAQKVFDWGEQLLLYINNVAEKSTKITSDKRLERMGIKQDERDVETRQYGGSPDFQQIGNLVRKAFLNYVFPFINPAIQGPRLDLKRLSEGGWRGTGTSNRARFRMMTNLILPTLLAAAYLKYGEWKDDFKELKRNNPQLFQDNLVIPLPYKGTRRDGTYGWMYMLKPVRDTEKNLHILVDGLLDLLTEQNPGALENFLYQSVTSWSPFDTQWSDLSKFEGVKSKGIAIAKDVAFSVLASSNPLLRAVPEQIANLKAYSRTPIVSGRLKIRPSIDQWTPTTPRTYKNIAQRLGVSPVRLQYLVEQFAGSVPTDFSKWFGQALPIENDEERLLSDPIARRFVGVVSSRDEKDVEDFFERTNEVSKTYQGYQLRAKYQGNLEEAQKYLDAHPELQYRKAIASLASKMGDVSGGLAKIQYNVTMTPEEKRAEVADLEAQKKDILDAFQQVWQEVKQIKGEAIPEKQSLLEKVGAAEFTPVTPEQASIKDYRKMTEKYKQARDFFDMADEFGRGYENAKNSAKRIGIDPAVAEYDYHSSQDLRERKMYINSLLQSQPEQGMWNTLVSLRKESPGTGNMVLSDALISDLVDEGYLSKSQGTQLRKIKIKTNTNGEQLMKVGSGGGSGGSRLSDLKHISTLVEQRGQAYQKALKVGSPKIKMPKISFPKAPKIPKIKLAPMTTTSSRFKLRIPKRTSIKTSGRMQSLIRVRK